MRNPHPAGGHGRHRTECDGYYGRVAPALALLLLLLLLLGACSTGKPDPATPPVPADQAKAYQAIREGDTLRAAAALRDLLAESRRQADLAAAAQWSRLLAWSQFRNRDHRRAADTLVAARALADLSGTDPEPVLLLQARVAQATGAVARATEILEPVFASTNQVRAIQARLLAGTWSLAADPAAADRHLAAAEQTLPAETNLPPLVRADLWHLRGASPSYGGAAEKPAMLRRAAALYRSQREWAAAARAEAELARLRLRTTPDDPDAVRDLVGAAQALQALGAQADADRLFGIAEPLAPPTVRRWIRGLRGE